MLLRSLPYRATQISASKIADGNPSGLSKTKWVRSGCPGQFRSPSFPGRSTHLPTIPCLPLSGSTFKLPSPPTFHNHPWPAQRLDLASVARWKFLCQPSLHSRGANVPYSLYTAVKEHSGEFVFVVFSNNLALDWVNLCRKRWTKCAWFCLIVLGGARSESVVWIVHRIALHFPQLTVCI